MIRSKVEQLCKKNNISLKELENQCGFGNGTIYKWDKSMPTIQNLNKVAQFFKVPVDFFLKN